MFHLLAAMNDEMLHRLAVDPEFDSRPTVPCPPPLASTIPAPAAPPVEADDFEDGWL